MNSPSIFSVTVERTPSAPLAASSRSSRSGGASERTLTSKSSRGRSPASGISRVTSTFSGTGSSLYPVLLVLFEHLTQHGVQDAAVAQVFDLYGRVHARLDPELL